MMKKSKSIPPYMEICLCHRCADVYYNDPNYWIEKTQYFQSVLEVCSVCRQYRGLYYSIWKKPSNVRFYKSHR